MSLFNDLVGPAAIATGYVMGGPAGAAIAAGGLSYMGTQSTNATNTSNANAQMAFSASQAATIYQRGAADLAAAGINPILAYGSPAGLASMTVPNIQPSLSLASNAATSAYDVASGALDKQAHAALTSAQTTTEEKRPEQVVAETGATTAATAKTKQDTMLSSEHTKTEKLRQQLISGEIGLQKIQSTVMQADVYLKSAAAQRELSTASLNAAHQNIATIEAILKNPQVRSVLDHPDLHESAATSGAVGDLAKPLFNLISSIRPSISIKTSKEPTSAGSFDSLTNTWRK